jgi:hypothetical protein
VNISLFHFVVWPNYEALICRVFILDVSGGVTGPHISVREILLNSKR